MNRSYNKLAVCLALAPLVGGVIWVMCKISAIVSEAGLENLAN